MLQKNHKKDTMMMMNLIIKLSQTINSYHFVIYLLHFTHLSIQITKKLLQTFLKK